MAPVAHEDKSLRAYLLLWVLTLCVFFTASGNILWTYVLPGLPPLAMLAALWLKRVTGPARPERLLSAGVAATALVSIALVTAFNLSGWDERKSAKSLVSDFESQRSAGEALVFFTNLPLSGSFYTSGQAEFARAADDLQVKLAQGPAFVVIRSKHLNRVPDTLLSQLRLVGQRGDYRLYRGGLNVADSLASRGAEPTLSVP
jgi:hypothetical protein